MHSNVVFLASLIIDNIYVALPMILRSEKVTEILGASQRYASAEERHIEGCRLYALTWIANLSGIVIFLIDVPALTMGPNRTWYLSLHRECLPYPGIL